MVINKENLAALCTVRISRLTAAEWMTGVIYLDYVAICGRRCVICCVACSTDEAPRGEGGKVT
jgi:hypothetical protein